MELFKVLGQTMYINPENGDFAINPEELRNGPLRQISSAPPYSPSLYKCITLCLEISDACNLRCPYCFNPNKAGTRMSYETAVKELFYTLKFVSEGHDPSNNIYTFRNDQGLGQTSYTNNNLLTGLKNTNFDLDLVLGDNPCMFFQFLPYC